jgi:hypothetical protein
MSQDPDSTMRVASPFGAMFVSYSLNYSHFPQAIQMKNRMLSHLGMIRPTKGKMVLNLAPSFGFKHTVERELQRTMETRKVGRIEAPRMGRWGKEN